MALPCLIFTHAFFHLSDIILITHFMLGNMLSAEDTIKHLNHTVE